MQNSNNAVARMKYAQKVRNQRAGVPWSHRADPLPTLEKPKTPVWWGGDPAFAGLVPREEQAQDMLITVAPWENGAPAGREDTFIFEWKRSDQTVWQVGNTQLIPGPIEPGDPDIKVSFEMHFFQQHGTYNLRYRVREWTGNDEALSHPTDIIIDKEAPNYNGESPAPATFDPLVADGITEAYLAANGDVLTLTIPNYEGEALGDTVRVYIEGRSEWAYDGPLLTGRTVTIAGNTLRSLPDGELQVRYRLTDKVGNAGQPSDLAAASLLLRPLPVEPLADPVVELADDGVIDLDDVRTTTRLVAVPLYGNWQPGDYIVVNWGGIVTPSRYPVGSNPQNPMYIDTPFADVLLPAYGDTTTGRKPTDVFYTVYRGLRPFNSNPIRFDVDFYVPGPTNPVRPDPENPALPQLEVYGDSDTGKVRMNQLVAGDVGGEVTIDLELYTPITAGENLIFCWAADDNVVHTHTPTPADAGTPYSFKIPWAAIESQPSGDAVKVWYHIGLVAGGNREMRITEVDASDALPVVLAQPDFPDKGMTTGNPPEPILNCNSYRADDPSNPTDYYLRVTFPPNPGVLVNGDTVEIEFQGYTDMAGTVPAGTPFTLDHQLAGTDQDGGFTINVTDYKEHIEPIGRAGSAKVTYTKQGTRISGSLSILAVSTRAGGPCWILPPP